MRRALLVLVASVFASPVLTLGGSEGPLPGMPPVFDPHDVYAAARPGEMSPVVRGVVSRVYVPNSRNASVDVIDPATYKIVNHFSVGREPQHVTPSYDLKTLWVLADRGDALTRIDPLNGEKKQTVAVEDPYNMYYTPDGRYAIVVAERKKRLDFRDAESMALVHSLRVPCRGVDHMDFSANGRYLLASCEFSSDMVKVDVAEQKVLDVLPLPGRAMPQDVRLSPDGSVFFVAAMMTNGVFVIDGDEMKILGFIPTGRGTHGLYFSRDSKWLYASNRGEGSISVIDVKTRRVDRKWTFPGGGSPDMGGVSADGKVLWLSGRYHSEVYAIDTATGKLLARIKVGTEPHGLCVWPQPGRYSLGHGTDALTPGHGLPAATARRILSADRGIPLRRPPSRKLGRTSWRGPPARTTTRPGRRWPGAGRSCPQRCWPPKSSAASSWSPTGSGRCTSAR
jgi:YVTN family beta-propeller protein